MKIPYGISDFGQIRDEGFFYADKTPFVPVLEHSSRHAVFLRPRRFGKSTLVSMLEHYYDLGRAEHFDQLFQGLWVHEHPTPERSAYLVLTLDFSRVATDAGPEALRRTFLEAVRSRVRTFLLRYRDRIPPLGDLYPRLDDFQDAEALIGAVLDIVAATPHKVYLLIDEYDHFANRLLAGGAGDLYEAIVTKTGFVRTFYATIKTGTASGALARMFITGVTPLMLDDLSSTAAVERRDLLTRILGEGHIRSELVRQFGVESLSSHEPFLSLLYYLGMLTLGASPRDVIGYDLEIPNRVIRELQWEHMALMLKEQAEVDVNLDALKAALGAMAVEGDIEPFLGLFHGEVLGRLGIRDTRRLDEKALKLLLMVYASLGRAFHPLSEKEKAGMIVFVGTKRPLFRPWPSAPRAGGGRARKGAGR